MAEDRSTQASGITWEVETPKDTPEWTANYVASILADTLPELPPKEQKLGSSVVRWWEAKPGDAVIIAEGGTIDDRVFAEQICKTQLEAHGYKRAQFSFDHNDGLRKTADWPAIMEKAKRLIQSGQVTLLRNSMNVIAAHVIGDHGEYNCEIGRDDPNSQSITTWQCECSVPGSRIVMADGTVKKVEDIKTGDLVLTATGRAGIVGRTMSREYDGRIVGLRVTGSQETVWVTENHKLPTADLESLEAERWTAQHHSFLPQPNYIQQHEIDVSYHLPELVERDGWLYKKNKTYGSKRQPKARRTTSTVSPRQKPIPSRISIDENFARLAGLYLAEGIATPRGELRWSFHEEESHLVEEVIERLKIYGLDNAKASMKGRCKTVAVQSKPFSDLFKALFGTGSRDKRLNSQMMAMNQTALEVFFDAWVEGDGHFHKRDNRMTLSTTSDDLAMQARLILARIGRESGWRTQATNSTPLVPNGGPIHHITWRRETVGAITGRYNRWFERDQVTQSMEAPEYREYSGKVYNFEVLDEHTYVFAPGFVSFNCPWDQYAFQRTRQWKKYEARPCAHVLGAYWKSKSAPLDDYDPEQHGPMRGQKMGPPIQNPTTAPAVQGLPRQFNPDGTMGPPVSPLQGQIPGGPGQIGPPGAPNPPGAPQGPMTPSPPGIGPNPGAVGGPAQSPLAPPTAPGILPPSPLEQLQQLQPPAPGQTPGGMMSPPNSVSVPGAKMPSPFNPLQMPGTYSATQYYPQQAVILKNPVWGQAEGKSEAHGAGQYVEVPAVNPVTNQPQRAEVSYQDPTTGWIEIIVSNDEGKALEPFLTRCFVEPTDITPARNTDTGFIRRRD